MGVRLWRKCVDRLVNLAGNALAVVANGSRRKRREAGGIALQGERSGRQKGKRGKGRGRGKEGAGALVRRGL